MTLYDGDVILADLDSLGNREAEYVYDAGTDRPYLLVTGPTTVTGAQYFVQDAFGNVQGTVYDSVNVASTVTYSDWGVPTVTGDGTTESVANRLTWKGLPYDSVLALTYVRARWYDPLIGRFVSEDPLGLSAGINPYIFAEDDPINGFDPSGMDSSNPDSVCANQFHAAAVTFSNGISGCAVGGTHAQPLPGVTTFAFRDGPFWDWASPNSATQTVPEYPSSDGGPGAQSQKSFDPKTHYCGSHGLNFPDGDWKLACYIHDGCYDTPAAGSVMQKAGAKEACDFRLLQNMTQLCEAGSGTNAQAACSLVGVGYFAGLAVGGWKAFFDAQREAAKRGATK